MHLRRAAPVARLPSCGASLELVYISVDGDSETESPPRMQMQSLLFGKKKSDDTEDEYEAADEENDRSDSVAAPEEVDMSVAGTTVESRAEADTSFLSGMMGGVMRRGSSKGTEGASALPVGNPMALAAHGPKDLSKLDPEFLAPFEKKAEHPSAPPNFLKIGLHSARGLAAMDSEMFSSKKWSDPRMKFIIKAGTTRPEMSARRRRPLWRRRLVGSSGVGRTAGDVARGRRRCEAR